MAERAALRVLIVDDDEAIGALLRQVLASHGFGSPTVVTTGADALAADPVDVVLLDHQLPDTTGLEILAALRARPGHPSIILVTGHGGETLAASALRLGADDYLVKDAALVKLLPEVLERVRRMRALRDALAAAEQDLVRAERLAAIGELTVTLHHEINNPLMAASAEVELLLEAKDLPPAHRESVGSIKNTLDRIRDVLQKARDLRETKTTAYLDNVGMIDLGATGGERKTTRGDAVLRIADPDVDRVVALLLKHAGFTIQHAEDAAELARHAARLGVSLVVAGGAVGEPPMGGFTPPKDRLCTVVALAAGDGSAERAAGADHVVALPFDPGSFTDEVLRALEGPAGSD